MMNIKKRVDFIRRNLLGVLAVFLMIASGSVTAAASQLAGLPWPQNFFLQERAATAFVLTVEKPDPVIATMQRGGPPLFSTRQSPKAAIPTAQSFQAESILSVQQPFSTPGLLRIAQRGRGGGFQRQTPMAPIINHPAEQPKISIEQRISENTPADSFKLGDKTIERKDKATEELTGASKGFADEKAFEDKMKDTVEKGVGSVKSGTSLEDAANQFGVGKHDLPGQNKGGVILDDGTGIGPNTGGLLDHAPGPKDAAGGSWDSSPDLSGEGRGFVNINSMGGISAGVKGGISGDGWGASAGGSYDFGGKFWNAHGEGNYSDFQVGGSITGGVNQNTEGSFSGSYKGVGTNSKQVGGLIGGGKAQSSESKNSTDRQTPGDYSLHNRTPVDSSNTEQGVKESGSKEKKGDYNTKEKNSDNPADKPPKEDEGTATVAPDNDGINDTGGNARDIAKAKAAARKFSGDTGGMGDTGWGDKPGANDAQRQTIHVKKANNSAAALGLEKTDAEGDPNSVNTQALGPGAYPSVNTDKEILSPTTQPK